MRLSLLVAVERHPIGRRNVLMGQQTLHSLRKRADVARQAVEQSGVSPGIAHGNRTPVLIEVHPKCLPQTTGPELPVADKLAQLRASLSQIQPTSQKRRD
jgi:hypothetical protein